MGMFQDTVDVINVINVQYAAKNRVPEFIKKIIYKRNRKKVFAVVERYKTLESIDGDSLRNLFKNIRDDNPPFGTFGICKAVKSNVNAISGVLQFPLELGNSKYDIGMDIICTNDIINIRYSCYSNSQLMISFESVDSKQIVALQQAIDQLFETKNKAPDHVHLKNYANKQVILLAWHYLSTLYRKTGRILEI